MVLRYLASKPQLTPWEEELCLKDSGKVDEQQCEKRWERENFNWEKHLQLAEYLKNERRQFTHVLMMDADAAFSQLRRDTLREMATALEEANKEVFLTNEDWLQNGEDRINGGLIFVKNSKFSLNLFQDTFEAHVVGPGRGDRGLEKWRIGIEDRRCGGNEQDCLNQLRGLPEFFEHTLLSSGLRYNRGGCMLNRCGEPTNEPPGKSLGLADPKLDIIHFMGGSKPAAQKAFCTKDVSNKWDEGPMRYGCAP